MDFPIFGNKPGEAGGSSQAPLDAAPNVMEEPHSYAHDTLGGVAQQDVPSHQKLYVRYANTTEAIEASEWKLSDTLRHSGVSARLLLGKPDFPISVGLALVQAPAAFAYPIVQRKPFKPPFMLRMTIQYELYVNIQVSMEAHVITDVHHSKPQAWAPEPHSAEKHPELDNAKIQRNVKAGNPQAATPGEIRTHVEDFEFTELKFVKSSRMNKRWLVFSCYIESDMLYVLYSWPTVIISRRTDQYEKAYESLRGHAPNMQKKGRLKGAADLGLDKPSDDADLDAGGAQRLNFEWVKAWVLETYASRHFRRMLNDDDIKGLLTKANLDLDTCDITLDSEAWYGFKEYVGRLLDALQEVQDVWERTGPPLIWDLACSRADAEQILGLQQPGTFLIRVCATPGSFCISCKIHESAGNVFVDHLLIDVVDLAKKSLVSYIEMHPCARFLVSPSNELIRKEELLRLLNHSIGPWSQQPQLPSVFPQPSRGPPPALPNYPMAPPGPFESRRSEGALADGLYPQNNGTLPRSSLYPHATVSGVVGAAWPPDGQFQAPPSQYGGGNWTGR